MSIAWIQKFIFMIVRPSSALVDVLTAATVIKSYVASPPLSVSADDMYINTDR